MHEKGGSGLRCAARACVELSQEDLGLDVRRKTCGASLMVGSVDVRQHERERREVASWSYGHFQALECTLGGDWEPK